MKVLLVGSWACGRSQPESHGQDAPSASAHAADAAPAAKAGPAGTPAPAPPRGVVATWHGAYKSGAGELYIPSDWKNVHWNVKDSDVGIGDGTLALRVDPATGRVAGTLDGPLGPATIDGLAADGKLTATVGRKDPGDEGFTGTMDGSIAPGRAEGTLHLSRAMADGIRVATFSLSPEDAPR